MLIVVGEPGSDSGKTASRLVSYFPHASVAGKFFLHETHLMVASHNFLWFLALKGQHCHRIRQGLHRLGVLVPSPPPIEAPAE